MDHFEHFSSIKVVFSTKKIFWTQTPFPLRFVPIGRLTHKREVWLKKTQKMYLYLQSSKMFVSGNMMKTAGGNSRITFQKHILKISEPGDSYRQVFFISKFIFVPFFWPKSLVRVPLVKKTENEVISELKKFKKSKI